MKTKYVPPKSEIKKALCDPNKHYNLIINTLIKNRLHLIETEFDFPDYGGLPEELYTHLNTDFVDAIQWSWQYLLDGKISEFRKQVNFYKKRWNCIKVQVELYDHYDKRFYEKISCKSGSGLRKGSVCKGKQQGRRRKTSK